MVAGELFEAMHHLIHDRPAKVTPQQKEVLKLRCGCKRNCSAKRNVISLWDGDAKHGRGLEKKLVQVIKRALQSATHQIVIRIWPERLPREINNTHDCSHEHT